MLLSCVLILVSFIIYLLIKYTIYKSDKNSKNYDWVLLTLGVLFVAVYVVAFINTLSYLK